MGGVAERERCLLRAPALSSTPSPMTFSAALVDALSDGAPPPFVRVERGGRNLQMRIRRKRIVSDGRQKRFKTR